MCLIMKAGILVSLTLPLPLVSVSFGKIEENAFSSADLGALLRDYNDHNYGSMCPPPDRLYLKTQKVYGTVARLVFITIGGRLLPKLKEELLAASMNPGYDCDVSWVACYPHPVMCQSIGKVNPVWIFAQYALVCFCSYSGASLDCLRQKGDAVS